MRCYGAKPRSFMEKVPSGLLPVLEVDGQIITESAVIQSLLEQLYPENPLMPPQGTRELQRAGALMQLERQLFGDWLNYLCRGAQKARFEATMDAVDHELGVVDGPYFLEDFSLVDIVFAPFLERIVASVPYYKGEVVRGQGRWPNLEKWFDAMETRPAYVQDSCSLGRGWWRGVGANTEMLDSPLFGTDMSWGTNRSLRSPLVPLVHASTRSLTRDCLTLSLRAQYLAFQIHGLQERLLHALP